MALYQYISGVFAGIFTLCSLRPAVQSIIGSMLTSAASCFPRSDSSFRTDGSFLSVFMTLITTLASLAASIRSTFFP